MKHILIISTTLLLLLFAGANFAQSPDPSPTEKEQNESGPETIESPKAVTEKNFDNNKIDPPKPIGKGNTEIDFSYTEESLSNGFGAWRSASISVLHKFSRRKAVYGIYSETERFGKRDRLFMAGVYQPINKDWTLFLEGNVSPTHKVLSKWSALAQIERTVGKTLILKGGYRRSKFASSSANVGVGEAEKYFGNNRAAYTLYYNHLENGGTSTSHRVQYSRYYGENVSSVNISAGFGRELESLGELGLLRSNVKNFSVNGRHWVKKSLGVNYGFTLHDQGNIYTRRGLTFGLRYKF